MAGRMGVRAEPGVDSARTPAGPDGLTPPLFESAGLPMKPAGRRA